MVIEGCNNCLFKYRITMENDTEEKKNFDY